MNDVVTRLEQATLSRMAWERIATDPLTINPAEPKKMLAWRRTCIAEYAETFDDVYMRAGIKEYYDTWDYFALAALKRGYARIPAYVPWESLEGCAGALVLAAHSSNITFAATYRGIELGAAPSSPPSGLAERFHVMKAQEATGQGTEVSL
jgi:hypothetical protein